MKNFVYTGLIIFVCSSSLFAQSIITKSGLHVNSDECIITADRFIFSSKLSNNRDYILYSEIDTIKGYINPTHKNDILKINDSVVFVNQADSPTKKSKNDLTDDVYFVPAKAADKSYQPYDQSLSGTNLTTGDYLKRAGTRYLTGLTLAFGGGIVMGVGMSEESEAAIIAGGLMSLTGVIISITGHFQLIKAGNRMNSDAVTISSASNGIGLAINF